MINLNTHDLPPFKHYKTQVVRKLDFDLFYILEVNLKKRIKNQQNWFPVLQIN